MPLSYLALRLVSERKRKSIEKAGASTNDPTGTPEASAVLLRIVAPPEKMDKTEFHGS